MCTMFDCIILCNTIASSYDIINLSIRGEFMSHSSQCALFVKTVTMASYKQLTPRKKSVIVALDREGLLVEKLQEKWAVIVLLYHEFLQGIFKQEMLQENVETCQYSCSRPNFKAFV